MIVEEEDSIEIEKIESHRILTGKLEYRIKFKGYQMLEWIPANYFQRNKCDLLEKYNRGNDIVFDGDNSKISPKPKLKHEKIAGDFSSTKSNKKSSTNKNENFQIPIKKIKIEENVRAFTPQPSTPDANSYPDNTNSLPIPPKELKSERNVRTLCRKSSKFFHNKNKKILRTSVKENRTNENTPAENASSSDLSNSKKSVQTPRKATNENKDNENVHLLATKLPSRCNQNLPENKKKRLLSSINDTIKENTQISTTESSSTSNTEAPSSNSIRSSVHRRDRKIDDNVSVSRSDFSKSNTDCIVNRLRNLRNPLKNRLSDKCTKVLSTELFPTLNSEKIYNTRNTMFSFPRDDIEGTNDSENLSSRLMSRSTTGVSSIKSKSLSNSFRDIVKEAKKFKRKTLPVSINDSKNKGLTSEVNTNISTLKTINGLAAPDDNRIERIANSESSSKSSTKASTLKTRHSSTKENEIEKNHRIHVSRSNSELNTESTNTKMKTFMAANVCDLTQPSSASHLPKNKTLTTKGNDIEKNHRIHVSRSHSELNPESTNTKMKTFMAADVCDLTQPSSASHLPKTKTLTTKGNDSEKNHRIHVSRSHSELNSKSTNTKMKTFMAADVCDLTQPSSTSHLPKTKTLTTKDDSHVLTSKSSSKSSTESRNKSKTLHVSKKDRKSEDNLEVVSQKSSKSNVELTNSKLKEPTMHIEQNKKHLNATVATSGLNSNSNPDVSLIKNKSSSNPITEENKKTKSKILSNTKEGDNKNCTLNSSSTKTKTLSSSRKERRTDRSSCIITTNEEVLNSPIDTLHIKSSKEHSTSNTESHVGKRQDIISEDVSICSSSNNDTPRPKNCTEPLGNYFQSPCKSDTDLSVTESNGFPTPIKDILMEESASILTLQSEFTAHLMSLSPKYNGPNFTESSIDSSLYSAESLSGYTTDGDLFIKDDIVKINSILSPPESIMAHSIRKHNNPIKSILRVNGQSPPMKRVKLQSVNSFIISSKETEQKSLEAPMNIDILLPVIATNNKRVFDHILRIYERSVLCQIVKDNPCLLVLAAINNSLIIVNTLLGLGANVNGTDHAGTTALIAACNNGNETMLDLLIKRGADVNIMSHGKNKVLEKCILSNNHRLFKRVLSARADYSSVEHLIVDKSSEMALILDEHKKRILEPLNIRIRSSHNQFYKNIVERMDGNHGLKIVYEDQTLIPPNLKINRLARKMVLFSCVTAKSYTMEQILEGPLLYSFEIHVAQNEGQLVACYNGKRLLTTLNVHNTYYVSKDEACMWKFSVRPMADPSNYAFICGLELYMTGGGDDNKSSSTSNTKKDYGYLYDPTEEDFNMRRSFIRVPLSIEEIRSRLVFVDVEWRETVRYTLTPVNVAIINYDDLVLMDTKICPRDRLRKTDINGYHTKDDHLIGCVDEFKAKDTIRDLIRGKILVCHSSKKFLNNLDIDRDALCGVRDISNAIVIRKLLQGTGEYVDIKNIAKKLSIDEEMAGPSMVAMAIRRIYLAVESDWEDDIVVGQVKAETCVEDVLPYNDVMCASDELPDLGGQCILSGDDLPDLGGQCLMMSTDTPLITTDNTLLQTTAISGADYDILDILDSL